MDYIVTIPIIAFFLLFAISVAIAVMYNIPKGR